MKRTLLRLVMMMGLWAVSIAQVSSQLDPALYQGTITGQVLDMDGNPVANAWVIATKEGFGPVPSTSTDEAGQFKLEYVKVNNTYQIMASKMEEGYLYTCGLYLDCPSTGTCPKVTLTSSTRRADVMVRFGPKGGRVAGVVRDARNNKPVANAVITLYGNSKMPTPSFIEVQSDGQGAFISDALPLCPVRMKVEVPGYRTWYFNEAVSEKVAEDLIVESSSTKRLEIRLVPQ